MDSEDEGHTSPATLERLVSEHRAIIDAAKDALFVHDADCRITRANRAYAERAGKPYKEIIGRRYWQVYPGLDGPMPACRHLAEAAAEDYTEETLHLPDGETVYTRVFPIFDETGSAYACLHVFVDIATTKALQDALHESRQRLSLALSAAAAGTWEWNIVDDCVVWDCCLKPAAEPRDKVFTGTLDQSLEFVVPGDREALRRALTSAVDDGDRFRHEFRMRTPDGSLRYVVLQTRIHRDKHGGPVRMVGLCRDVTARREAEEENRWLAEIVRSANAAIVGLSPDGTIISWNDSAARLYGYSAGEVMGRNFIDKVIPREARAEVADLFARAKRGERITYEADRRTPQGKRIWVAVTLSPVFDGEGSLRGVSASILDITQQKLNEKERTEGQLRLHKALLGTIEAVSRTLEFRDPYTAGHQNRVGALAIAMAKRLGWPQERIEGLHLGSYVHDCGKIYVPAEILTRPGRLTRAEYEIIKEHPRIGAEILGQVDLPWPIVDMVRHHHERLDGSGYPDGLRGDQISLEARVLAVADVVEAMSSHRPYRPGLGMDYAAEEIKSNRERLYCPQAVDACLDVIAAGEFTAEQDV